MSSIGNITQLLQPVVPQAQNPLPVPANAAPVPTPSKPAGDQVDVGNAPVSEQALQPKVPIANPEILGTGTFSLFTVGNVLYTRQTERTSDGSVKVTYEPRYPGISSGSGRGGLDITA